MTNGETALLVGADGPNPGGLAEGCNQDENVYYPVEESQAYSDPNSGHGRINEATLAIVHNIHQTPKFYRRPFTFPSKSFIVCK